jgi:uridine kinase
VRKVKTIIGLCGGSGSGKTSIVDKISNEFDKSDITVLSMDDYYKSVDEQQKDENGEVNFDLPDAINIDQICRDIEALINGEKVTLLEYTFNNPLVEPKSKELYPNKILIIEGIFLLYYPEILEKMDFTVYIDVKPSVQLARRLKRDLETRGYSADQIKYQWENHVIPCFENYIKPFIDKADIIIDNNEKDAFNIEPVISKIHLSEV